MSYHDFCICTPEQFYAICREYNRQRESEYKDGWEQTRLLYGIEAQTHSTRRIDMTKVMPFSWDKGKAHHKTNELSPESYTKDEYKKKADKAIALMGEHY